MTWGRLLNRFVSLLSSEWPTFAKWLSNFKKNAWSDLQNWLRQSLLKNISLTSILDSPFFFISSFEPKHRILYRLFKSFEKIIKNMVLQWPHLGKVRNRLDAISVMLHNIEEVLRIATCLIWLKHHTSDQPLK